ncbi:hypothetical protein A9P82_10300 [Arachidicoccus ginsenosidimutans]|uniref:DUF4961 domain-containing protein n=1 Tax=Arachidicoccus sp. BS20 TaxID=1850526 RepID=UPI0007F10C49|nr:DUF4961 domain-containing protein [Arachidicoccus sp. BS20]ANI89643.1 hypothetical protein A9P82_10300 [Arachidicoccus sp. BS20]
MRKSLNYIKRKIRWQLIAVGVVIALVVVACSITIDSIDQPDSVNGGETLQSTLHVTISTNAEEDNSKLMVAVLVPKVWNVASNASISFTSSITDGEQKMSVIPAGTAAPQGNGLDWPTLISNKIGHGGNLLPGWEWVAFYSNNAYNVGGNVNVSVTVNIKIKTSQDNISFKLGYVVAESVDGLSDPQYYNAAFPGCFRVFGTGDLIDFCNPQLSTVDPLNSLDNDIVTLSFDGGIIDNALANESNIFLCAKGITTDGDTLEVCRQDSTTKLVADGIKKWRIDIWPRGLFNLSADKQLASLQYYFTDASGNVKVGSTGDDSTPFTYTFKCQ